MPESRTEKGEDVAAFHCLFDRMGTGTKSEKINSLVNLAVATSIRRNDKPKPQTLPHR